MAGYRWRRDQQRWAYYGTDGHEIQSFQCYLKKQSAFADCSVCRHRGSSNGLTPNNDYKRILEMKPLTGLKEFVTPLTNNWLAKIPLDVESGGFLKSTGTFLKEK
ncbi:hypothetical protein J7J00_11135 [Bacillus sp. ISL-4]|nr:hypothetical protein [Bacillus sp. ISL-4]